MYPLRKFNTTNLFAQKSPTICCVNAIILPYMEMEMEMEAVRVSVICANLPGILGNNKSTMRARASDAKNHSRRSCRLVASMYEEKAKEHQSCCHYKHHPSTVSLSSTTTNISKYFPSDSEYFEFLYHQTGSFLTTPRTRW